jgi:hypothetical protein
MPFFPTVDPEVYAYGALGEVGVVELAGAAAGGHPEQEELDVARCVPGAALRTSTKNVCDDMGTCDADIPTNE